MTRDEAREYAKVVQAYADGKDVQMYAANGWRDIHEDPCFDSGFESYRIKPEPREWWVVLDCNMGGVNYKYSTQEAATASAEKLSRTCSLAPYTVFHVREVMP